MSLSIRTGSYGTYWGSSYDSSQALNIEQMMINAIYITNYFLSKGWTKNAIAGMLGNLQVESTLNPGRWQNDDPSNISGGYGLVQWTPSTNYTAWCSMDNRSDPSTMDNNLDRIMYELNNGFQWIATDEYPMSFEEFTKSTQSPSYLASVFLKNYERAGVEVESLRKGNATSWFTIINNGSTPDQPSTPTHKKKKGFNFILFNRRRRFING